MAFQCALQAMHVSWIGRPDFLVDACLQKAETKTMTAVGFEPTQLALVELESTPLDHSGKLSLTRCVMVVAVGRR